MQEEKTQQAQKEEQVKKVQTCNLFGALIKDIDKQGGKNG
jgi:hypothetical protein